MVYKLTEMFRLNMGHIVLVVLFLFKLAETLQSFKVYLGALCNALHELILVAQNSWGS